MVPGVDKEQVAIYVLERILEEYGTPNEMTGTEIIEWCAIRKVIEVLRRRE